MFVAVIAESVIYFSIPCYVCYTVCEAYAKSGTRRLYITLCTLEN